MNEIFTADVGTEIILDCGVDIHTATAVSIIAMSPQNTRKTFTAALYGTRSIRYITASGDFDVGGVWRLQASVALPGWSGRGAVTTLKVSALL
jgi:hypothetical protein